MNRPLFETEADRLHERLLADTVEKLWQCKFIKLPISYRLDWALVRNNGNSVKAFAETKRRLKRGFDQYPDLFLSVGKVMAAADLCRITRLPAFLIVQFNDAIAYCNLPGPDFETIIGGRTDRDDWQDIEPVALIPMSRFTVLKRFDIAAPVTI